MSEVEFRDGPSLVPDYVARLLERVDTVRYTKEQALAMVNDLLLSEHINNRADAFIRSHFQNLGSR